MAGRRYVMAAQKGTRPSYSYYSRRAPILSQRYRMAGRHYCVPPDKGTRQSYDYYSRRALIFEAKSWLWLHAAIACRRTRARGSRTTTTREGR